MFRIVQSKDGGICRIKLALGRTNAVQARAIAAASARWGNGEIEITNRANFQIRGVGPEHENTVIQALLDAGLGPTDAQADDIRNVMVSPTLGGDLSALCDVSDLAAQILSLLESDPRHHGLSPKFSILVDGGEDDSAVDHPHDIWISALDGRDFAFGFAGHPPLIASDRPPAGAVPGDAVLPLIRAALDLFLERSGQDSAVKRFRDIADLAGFSAVLAQRLAVLPPPSSWLRRPPDRLAHVGLTAQKQPGMVMVGGVPALGRVSPQTLISLANLAVRANGGAIRLTPWQSVLLPDIPKSRGVDVRDGLKELGFSVERRDPLAQMVACSGTVGCGSALTPSKQDARLLAGLLKSGMDVHVTACPKSCASARSAAFTLVAVDALSYDVYRRDHVGQAGFGTRIGQALSIVQASELLQ